MERTVPRVNVISQLVRPGDPADDYPEVPVFRVEVSTDQETWLESFGSEAEVQAFLRGLQAGSQMTGGPYLHLPLEIPRPR